MTSKDIAALAQAIVEAMRAQVSAPVSAPVAPAAAAPVYTPDLVGTGKVCVCGHEHARPVVSAQRARLQTETACHVKGCVSRPACSGLAR